MARDVLRQAVSQHLQAHTKFCAAEGFSTAGMSEEKADGILGQVLDSPQLKGIPITQILGILGPILNMIFAGNPIGAIIAQILALLHPTTPA